MSHAVNEAAEPIEGREARIVVAYSPEFLSKTLSHRRLDAWIDLGFRGRPVAPATGVLVQIVDADGLPVQGHSLQFSWVVDGHTEVNDDGTFARLSSSAPTDGHA